MKITMDGKYTTRDGRTARIFTVDGGGKYPVIGAVEGEGGVLGLDRWTDEGRFFDGMPETGRDLIPVVEKPREVWVNAYPNGVYSAHPTRLLADRNSRGDRTECLHVKYTAGEGL